MEHTITDAELLELCSNGAIDMITPGVNIVLRSEDASYIYRWGLFCVTKKESVLAFRCFERASLLGNADAHIKVGDCYETGDGE